MCPGGPSSGGAVGQVGTNLVGVKRDVGEEVSVKKENLLGLVTFQSKESIQDVCVGAESNGEQQNEVMELLKRYEEIFTEIPGKASVIEHKIDLTDDRPIRCKPYPLPYAKRGEIREEIKNMMDTRIVRELSSPYASPLVVVKKKDGSNRMCVDYRKLNLVTVADPAPMTTAEDLFGKVRKCQYYSTIDLSKGYLQIPVAEEGIHKTAFVTPDGCYEYVRMPFGMKNSGATLVRGMRKLLQDMDNVECYIDNLIVYKKDWATHLQVLNTLLEKLRRAGLVIQPTKCVLGSKSVEFLRHSIGENCISINEENLEKIRGVKRPTKKKEVRSFLGLANYYRDQILSFAAIAAPLSDLTKKGLPESVRGEEAQEEAFVTLRESLVRRPILRLPNHKTFILRTDASNCGFGAALMQEHEERFFPIAYGSKKLTSAERKYSTIEKECLAIVWGVSKFRRYLAGKPLVLQTDHQPLTFLKDAKFRNDRIMRWALALQGYDHTVKDIPGKDNVVVDYSSRLVVDSENC